MRPIFSLHTCHVVIWPEGNTWTRYKCIYQTTRDADNTHIAVPTHFVCCVSTHNPPVWSSSCCLTSTTPRRQTSVAFPSLCLAAHNNLWSVCCIYPPVKKPFHYLYHFHVHCLFLEQLSTALNLTLKYPCYNYTGGATHPWRRDTSTPSCVVCQIVVATNKRACSCCCCSAGKNSSCFVSHLSKKTLIPTFFFICLSLKFYFFF